MRSRLNLQSNSKNDLLYLTNAPMAHTQNI
jgi:hypothetical protein